MIRLSFLSIAVVLIVGMPSHVQASIVNLTFSGTYKTMDLEEEVGAFSYSMTYDTTLDTNTESFATGADLSGLTTYHEWHGYSASGIIDLDFQFDGMEWLLSEHSGNVPREGVTEGLWFDVDLATGATPTLAWFKFNNSSSDLYLGVMYFDDENIGLGTGSTIVFSSDVMPSIRTNSLTITRSDPDPIPEPASVITWTLLGVVGCIATWWKRRR